MEFKELRNGNEWNAIPEQSELSFNFEGALGELKAGMTSLGMMKHKVPAGPDRESRVKMLDSRVDILTKVFDRLITLKGRLERLQNQPQQRMPRSARHEHLQSPVSHAQNLHAQMVTTITTEFNQLTGQVADLLDLFLERKSRDPLSSHVEAARTTVVNITPEARSESLLKLTEDLETQVTRMQRGHRSSYDKGRTAALASAIIKKGPELLRQPRAAASAGAGAIEAP